jgi:hypothetical protein
MSQFIVLNEVQLCVSNIILEEYKGVAQRDKFKKYPNFIEKATAFIQRIEEIALIVEPKTQLSLVDDESDNRFLEVAIEANAFCVITGNHQDFTQLEYEQVKIYSPKEFYELMINQLNTSI